MSGHIRRRGIASWELKFDVTNPAGARKTVYRSFRGTKREAQAELTRLLADADRGVYVDASRETVGGFLDRWLKDWAGANVSPKTLERYVGLVHKQIRPHIGGLLLQKLRPSHLNELYATLLRKGRGDGTGLAPRTIVHCHRLLHQSLGHATKWDLVQQNVASVVSPPRVAATEVEILRQEQIDAVLRKLQGRSMYMIAALGLATGMRRGELLALRWQDVDLDGAKLQVERSLEQTKAGLRFKAPKTRHSRRSITLPASTVAELRTHWKAQQEQRLALGLGKAPDDALVFPTWDGKPRSPNALTKAWSVAMAEAGLAATFHSLRHTHASALIAAGLDVLTISRRLGHASATITLGVYGHLFANTDDRAALVIEAMFSRTRTE